LMLARAVARRREVALRLAMGASRTQLAQQFLTEGALLALCSTVLGAALSPALAQLATALPQPAYALPGASVELDWRVLGFALLMAAGSAVLAASMPAWRASRTDLQTPLREGTPGARRSNSRSRGALVAAQVALSLALLASAETGVQTVRRG